MKTKSRDFKTSLVVLALSGVLFYGSFFTRKMMAMSTGPEFMPRLLAGLMLLFGIILLVKSLAAKNESDSPRETVATQSSRGASTWKQLVFDRYAHYSLWFCMLVYAFSMQRLGFVLSSSFMIFTATWLMAPKRERRPMLFIIISVVVPVAIYLLFTKVFLLMLPDGILG